MKTQQPSFNLHLFILIAGLLSMNFLNSCEQQQKDDEETVTEIEETESPRTTEHFESDSRGIEDPFVHEFVDKYPEMEFAYVPTQDGKIRTVKGNFQVEVDGIEGPEELNKFVKHLERTYERRDSLRKVYNQGIETVAEPVKGYEAYFDAVEKNLQASDSVVGETVFVEFVVTKEGEVTDVNTVDYYTTDETRRQQVSKAAEDAVQQTDWEWKPAIKDGEPTKMKIEIPITFPAEDS